MKRTLFLRLKATVRAFPDAAISRGGQNTLHDSPRDRLYPQFPFWQKINVKYGCVPII